MYKNSTEALVIFLIKLQSLFYYFLFYNFDKNNNSIFCNKN